MNLNFAIRRHGETSWAYAKTYGLFVAKMNIPDPEPKTSTEDVMGISGLLDFSEVNGLCFHNRLISLECKLAEGAAFDARDFKSRFLGRNVDLIVLSGNTVSDTDFYYTGRLTISENTLHRRDPGIKFAINAEPFRYPVSAAERRVSVDIRSTLASGQVLLNEIAEGNMNVDDYPGWSHTLRIGDDGVVTFTLTRGVNASAGGGSTIFLPTMSGGKYLLWCEEIGGHCTLGGMDEMLYSNTYAQEPDGARSFFYAVVAPDRDSPLEHRCLKFRLNAGSSAGSTATFRLAFHKISPETISNNGDLAVMPDFALNQDALVYLNNKFFNIKAGDDWNPYLQLNPGANEIAAFGKGTQAGEIAMVFKEAAF